MKLNNRKGMEVDFLLKFVLSAIGIAIVIFVVGTVLNRVFYDEDSATAKQTLSSLVAKADSLQNGEENGFIVRGVNGWFLVGWNLEDGDERSKRCLLNNCVCICKEPTKKGCDSREGVCLEVKDRKVSVRTEPFEIISGPAGPGGTASITRYDKKCIGFTSTFAEISVSKSAEALEFYYADKPDGSIAIGLCENR